MNIKRLVLCLILIVLVGVFVLWLIIPNPSPTKALGKSVSILATLSNSKPESNNIIGNQLSGPAIVSVTNDDIDTRRPDNISQEQWDVGVRYFRLKKLNNGPLEFYGLVIDQNSNVVTNAKVRTRIHVYNESFSLQLAKGGDWVDKKQIDVETDNNGMFSLSGGMASELLIESIEKDGYLISGRQLRNYSIGMSYGVHHHADRNKPEIFMMWKKGLTEPLVKRELRIETIVTDGRLYSVDLIRGVGSDKQTSMGDFRIKMTSDAQGARSDWSVVFEADSPMFQVSEESYLSMAPESDYTNTMRWTFERNDPKQWKGDIKRKFYVVNRTRHLFAGIEMEVYEYGNGKGRVILDYLLNPNNSRNLEYDPIKEIKRDALKALIQEMDQKK